MNDKKFLIKTYRGGTYQGTLPFVVEDYQFSQDINTAGSEITVKLGTDLTGAGIAVSVDYLIAQNGNHITDDFGNRITTRKDYMFNAVPVDIGNQADIWLYYSGAPNGVRIFSGLISSWEANDEDATITMTALSYGVQLDNYLIEVLPNQKLLNFTTYTTTDVLFANSDKLGPFNRTTAMAQTFQVISNTSISQVAMQLALTSSTTGGITATIQLYSGTPGGTITLLSSTSRLVTDPTMNLYGFLFPSPVALVTGTTYFMQLTIAAGIDISLTVGRDAGGTYTSGSGYTYNDTTGAWTATTGDYAFSVTTSTGSLGNQFNSKDPGQIVVDLLSSFTDAGGVVDCDDTSVSATGTTVSYTFKYNTYLEGIKKCLELAPPNWYWYVDVGSNVLYFKQFSLTPNHTFVKGLQVEKMKIKYTLEQMKNKVVFTGGDDGTGTNIISKQNNTASIAKYGQWLDSDSDNRVTTQSTADIIASNLLGEFSRPSFTASCSVLAVNYDIETLHMGQMVAFQNFNALTNSQILQIVSINRSPDRVDLVLATLPPVQAHRIEDIKRNLDAVITQNNPAQ